jgi:hypothetical protein
MGYRIVYDGREGKYEVKAHNPMRIWVALGVALLLIFSFWETGGEYVREALIPGDNQVTLAAVRSLKERLSQGVAWQEAVGAFCTDVIHGSIPTN